MTRDKDLAAATRESEQRLAGELSGSRLLQRLSTHLIPEQSPEALYEQILDAAMELMRADAASMQLLDADGKRLRRVATRNLHPDSTEYWTWVDASHASTCGQALSRNERVVVEDVEASPELAGTGDLTAFRASGTRAVQSTPLLTRNGRAVGMISTHWRAPRRIEENDFGLFDVLARQVADLIERSKTEAALRESEQKYRSLFETIGQGYCELELIRDEHGKAVDQLYLELNPAFERLFGIAVDEARGRKASEVFPYLDPIWTERFDEVARTGTYDRFEHQHGPLHPWFEVFVYPRGGDRLVVLYEEITDRKRAELALRKSEERQGFLLALGDAMRAEPAADAKIAVAAQLLGAKLDASRVLYAEYDHDRGFAHIFNGWLADGAQPFPPVVKLNDFEGDVLNDLRQGRVVRVDDVGRLGAQSGYAAIAEVGVQALLSPPLLVDGKLKFNISIHQHEPRHWTDDEVALVQEVSERLWAEIVRARAEEALRERDERYRLVVENAQSYAIFTLDPRGIVTDWYEGAERAFGYTREEMVGRDGAILFTPEDRAAGEVEKEMAEAIATGKGPNVRWHVRKDGTRVYIEGLVTPLTDSAGALTGFLKIGLDATERRRSQEHERTLLAELQHRVRNTLAIVRSIARRTAENSTSVEEMLAHFQGRLDAFSRVQAVLTRSAGATVDLASLIDDEMVAHAARDGEQVAIRGPSIALDAKTAERLSLAIHELATNAVKHGALSTDKGRISIRWHTDAGDGRERLLLRWKERGVELDGTPGREGFGTELLLRSLPYDLHGETRMDFSPDGLEFELSIPLSPADSTN